MRPTRDWRPPGGGCTYGGEQPPAVRRRLRPCLALLPAGVTWPRTLLRAPVVFYTTFSPSPTPPQPSPKLGRVQGGGGCLFLWPFPVGSRLSAVSPPRVLSDAVLYGVRTFLDPDNAGSRSPDRPEEILSYSQPARASIVNINRTDAVHIRFPKIGFAAKIPVFRLFLSNA